MKNPKPIFAIILAVIFCFAGFNLWKYFEGQQADQKIKEREAHELSLAKEKSRQAEIETQKERDKLASETKAEKDRLAAEAVARREEVRRQKEADAEAKRATWQAKAKERKNADLQERIERARTPRTIERIDPDVIEQLNDVSARYIRENPEEFLSQRIDANSFSDRRYKKLIAENTNALMLYSAISSDTDHIQALIDIGMDVNAANDRGVTPLMFASAYNTPEVVNFLIERGAKLNNRSGRLVDMNALHIASALNPKPDVVETLVKAGIHLESKTEGDLTPLLIAASDNWNLEVIERLVQLGADKEAYDEKGRTALAILKARRNGDGDEYYRISDEMEEKTFEIFK